MNNYNCLEIVDHVNLIAEPEHSYKYHKHINMFPLKRSQERMIFVRHFC